MPQLSGQVVLFQTPFLGSKASIFVKHKTLSKFPGWSTLDSIAWES